MSITLTAIWNKSKEKTAKDRQQHLCLPTVLKHTLPRVQNDLDLMVIAHYIILEVDESWRQISFRRGCTSAQSG